MSSCGPQVSAISPSGFGVRMMERKKTSPQIAIKNHRVKVWTTGMMSAGQDFTPKPHPPCPPSVSQIKKVSFPLNGFFFYYFHKKAPPRAGWTTPQEPPAHTEQKQFPLLATNATVLVLLRNRSNISVYAWILPNFNHLK